MFIEKLVDIPVLKEIMFTHALLTVLRGAYVMLYEIGMLREVKGEGALNIMFIAPELKKRNLIVFIHVVPKLI